MSLRAFISLRTILVAACTTMSALGALAAEPQSGAPYVGEEVPYVQTPQAVVDKMMELAAPGPGDYLIDLGSGDGRIVITAAEKYGTPGFGVEIDPRLVEMSNAAAKKAGVGERARFEARDLFETDISRATILTMYLLPEVNRQLRPRILDQLRPGTRVISHDWDMGEWQPDEKAVLEGVVKPVMPLRNSTVYLWIVPAKVGGLWKIRVDGTKPELLELELVQKFQEIHGLARRSQGRMLLQSAHLRGAEIRFAVVDESRRPSVPQQFFGRVYSDRMEGTTGTGRRWVAQRNIN